MSTSETITKADLTNILNKVLPVTSKVELEYVGNVSAIHWSSWTAPDDGIVVIDIGWLTNGSFGYYYVKDNTDDLYVGKVTTYTANGTSNTTSFPVLKGHTYQVANQANVDGSHIYFRYYKFKNPTATCGLADFIVEQGTSGIWTYRKWNSGIAECWGTASLTPTWVSYTAGLYFSSPQPTISYPFTITDAIVTANPNAVGSNVGWVANIIPHTSNVELTIVRNGNTGNATVQVSVKGRWK